MSCQAGPATESGFTSCPRGVVCNRSGRCAAETGESPSTPAVQVTQGGGINPFESADGKYLYYAKGRGMTGLWRKDLTSANGLEEPVIESLQYWGWWALAPQGIYFLEQPATPGPAKVHLKFLRSGVQADCGTRHSGQTGRPGCLRALLCRGTDCTCFTRRSTGPVPTLCWLRTFTSGVYVKAGDARRP